METMKETMRRVEREMMRQMIKQSRARWAALPRLAKESYIRNWEDEQSKGK